MNETPAGPQPPGGDRRPADGIAAERSVLEAGFLGLAVLMGLAGAVLVLIPLALSVLTGSFAVADHGLGACGLAFSGGFWVLSRLSRE